MEVHVSFRGRKPVPQHVDIGMERENKVTVLCFEGLPKMDGSTAYLHIDLGDNSDAIEIIDGQADITRTITQFTGSVEAFVEVLGANDRVWHSQIMELFVGRLPILGKKIEQAYPTAFEQALAQTAADKAAAAKSAADAAATAAGIVTEEAARQDAESKRVKAENSRETAEANREQAEAAREQEVADALEGVASAENTVQANEQQRVLAERTRAAQEQARQSAEQSRVEAEQARVSAESQRQQAETARADAESKRVQAEQGRVTAEQGRVKAEAQREEAMAQHAEKIAALEAKVAKKAQIDDTTISGTEAWSSQHIVDMLCPPLEASGNPIVCYPVAGSKLGITASWGPTQEGEGTPSPDNIRPIHGRGSIKMSRCGETLWGKTELITSEYNTDITKYLDLSIINDLPRNVNLYLYGNLINGEQKFEMSFYSSDKKKRYGTLRSNGRASDKLTSGEIGHVRLIGGNNDTSRRTFENLQITLLSIRPATYSPYVGSTTTLTIPSTIYGGKVGVEGNGKETWGYIKSYAGEALPAEWICDRAVYAEGGTPPTGAQVAYKLATPVPFTATGGGTIKALSGTNTILTDADALTVAGREDPIRIIQQLQAASASATQALADVERAVTDI